VTDISIANGCKEFGGTLAVKIRSHFQIEIRRSEFMQNVHADGNSNASESSEQHCLARCTERRAS
jgi:hypothetical protein